MQRRYYILIAVMCTLSTMLIIMSKIRNLPDISYILSTQFNANASLSIRSILPTKIGNIELKSVENVSRRHDLIIGIYVALKNASDNEQYAFAQTTLQCYARLHGYRLQFDYADSNARIAQQCTQDDVRMFRFVIIIASYFFNSSFSNVIVWRVWRCRNTIGCYSSTPISALSIHII